MRSSTKIGLIALLGIPISILTSPKSKAAIIDVPVAHSTNLQTYINSANPGDTLSFFQDDTTVLEGNFTIDKNLTIVGNSFSVASDTGYGFSITDDANVTLQDINLIGRYNIQTQVGTERVINVQDNASLNVSNSQFGGRFDSLYFDSTGNLTVSQSIFSGSERTQETEINLARILGDISVTENLFAYTGTGISLGSDATAVKAPEINILNNTLYEHKTIGIDLTSLLTSATGFIANNAITNKLGSALPIGGDDGISNKTNAGNVIIRDNNIYIPPPDEEEESLSALSKEIISAYSQESILNQDFSFPPGYVNPNANDFQLALNSQMIGKGVYVQDLTTWFPNQNQTYIGAYGPIPEPATGILFATGLVGLLISNRRKSKSPLNNNLDRTLLNARPPTQDKDYQLQLKQAA
tara:strand:- start:1085 stop:2317 length:1233 start_codon:yes stop_codon:yes gene_type:complete